jgi:hypothetical protein
MVGLGELLQVMTFLQTTSHHQAIALPYRKSTIYQFPRLQWPAAEPSDVPRTAPKFLQAMRLANISYPKAHLALELGWLGLV